MRRKKQKTRRILRFVIIVLILAAVGFCIYKFFFEEKKTPQEDTPTDQQIVVVDPVSKTVEQKPEEGNPEENKKPVQTYEGGNPNENEKLTGVITYAGATSNNVIIRVNIDQYVDGGTCVLKLIQNDSIKYEESSNLIADVSTSTCEGFNIARAKIEDGNYIIRIELSSNGKTGSISGELNI